MIIQCHECGRKVSTEATACLSCGAPPKISEITNQKSTQTEINYTNFQEATYQTTCTECSNPYLIKGRSLRIKDYIKCPNPECGKKTKTDKIPITHNQKEAISYNILSDYFSYDGRISVSQYWKSALLALPILVISSIISKSDPELVNFYPLIFFIIIHPLWIKRYHDHGLRSEWILVQLIGLIITVNLNNHNFNDSKNQEEGNYLRIMAALTAITNLGLGAILSFVPGAKKINRYGPPTHQIKTAWFT